MEKAPYENHVITFDLESGEELRVAFNTEHGVGFCLNDVCEILGIDRRDTRRSLCDEDIFQHRAPTDGGWQWMTFLTADSLYEILNRLTLGRVMPFISELKEWVLSAIICHIENEWGEPLDGESFNEATFHKFDKSPKEASTAETTNQSTDMSTEATHTEGPNQIIWVINLK